MEWVYFAISLVITIGMVVGVSFLAEWLTPKPDDWYDEHLKRMWKDTKNDVGR